MAAMSSIPNGTSIEALRGTASKDPKAAIQATAKQFESLFMQELMKSMRASTMSSGMLDNNATAMGTEMLDQQFAAKLSGMQGGLSAQIARQLERQLGGAAEAAAAGTGGKLPGASTLSRAADAGITRNLPRIAHGGGAQGFVSQHREAAQAAEKTTGIPADFILAQAALESGWGKREIRTADGGNSYNVFGIKAGANWRGKTTEVTTTEYIGGQPRKVKQTFRAYDNYGEAYADYAKLLKDNPRYSKVIEQGGSAHGFAANLQRAGYATDPAYASKLSRVIETTQRLARANASPNPAQA